MPPLLKATQAREINKADITEAETLVFEGHQTLRVTLAMEAGLTDHVWEIDELIGPQSQ